MLRKDGTLWLNIADTYCGTGNKGGYADPKNPKGRTGQRIARNSRVTGCKQKDLIGIPWLLAFSLREQGWYLRSDIIWQKQNPMPESCKDRPTRCYEHIFLLSKEKKYYYDAAAIAEPIAPGTAARYRQGRGAGHKYAEEVPGQGKVQGINKARSGGYYERRPYADHKEQAGRFGLSIPYRIRAGILPLIPRNLRKRAYWRAVRRAALSLTRFSAAVQPGLQRKALTVAISGLN